MQIHNVQPTHRRKTKTRVGRGGKRGTYSGRGQKGQKAHAAGRIRPDIRDRIKKVPKRRGYGKNRSRGTNDGRHSSLVVNLKTLNARFEDDEMVTPQSLYEKGLIGKRDMLTLPVKILGDGALTKRVSVSGCLLSASARDAIEKAGGTVAPASAPRS